MGKADANRLSVKLELQADCLAGVWANRADRARGILESGDVEEALNAASAIGDDRLQKQSRGTIVPESFTHGTSAQRQHWFRTGLYTGNPDACDTFAATSPAAADMLAQALESSDSTIRLAALKNRTVIAFTGRDTDRTQWLQRYRNENATAGNRPSHRARILRFDAELADDPDVQRSLLKQALAISRQATESLAIAATLFVHGYNEEFPEANRMVTQFADDLKFSGPVVLFSWPSQGSLTGYTVDETNAQWAQSHFLEVMSTILEKVPAHSIYLVGHSMGNRIIGNAMITLSGDHLESDLMRFREIIMIALDIDADVMPIRLLR